MVAVQGPATAGWQSVIAEGLVYGYLSRLLAFPDAERWTELRGVQGQLVGSIEPADEGLHERLTEVLEAVAATDLGEARRAHQLLFPLVESQDCPAYETAYRSRDIWVQTDLMADAAGFYGAHGVRVGMPRPERPDHIVVELEFMGLLARKEAAALEQVTEDQAAICRETGDAFLRDHLGCWGIDFGRRVEHLATAPYLAAAGRLLATWLEVELAVREVVPADRFGEPIAVDADMGQPIGDDVADACGPTPGAASFIPLEALTSKRRLDR